MLRSLRMWISDLMPSAGTMPATRRFCFESARNHRALTCSCIRPRVDGPLLSPPRTSPGEIQWIRRTGGTSQPTSCEDRAMNEAELQFSDISAPDGIAPDSVRLTRASWASTTRRVRGPLRIVDCTTSPMPGELFLARVDALGYHSALQLPDGRRRRLFEGDEIVVAYGNRYAPNQFEAVVPRSFGPCDLVAGGGVAARVLSWHGKITKEATQITPLARIAGATDAPANLKDYALPSLDRIPTPQPRTLVVCGTSMDSGKTQTAAFLVKGLSLAGLRVGFAKVTGTGSGGDTWLLKDAGANPVLDFTDAGLASTYLEPAWEIERVFTTLVGH